MTKAERRSTWRAAHGVVLVLAMGCAWMIPALRGWPLVWLAPLAVYFVLVGLIPPLRNSVVWPRFGQVSTRSLAAAVIFLLLAVAALVVFRMSTSPNLDHLAARIPVSALGGSLFGALIFSTLNGTLEELVFRGILFDALDSEWGTRTALGFTSVLFGLGHLTGYPSGIPGAFLAAMFGLMAGLLRVWTKGLALPIVVHVVVDITIYFLLLNPPLY